MYMNEIDFIDRIIDRIKNPQHWCQKALARNADGQGVLPESEDAVQWCVDGAFALEKRAFIDYGWSEARMLEFWGTFECKFWGSPAKYNDEFGHFSVMEKLHYLRNYYVRGLVR